MNQIVALQNCLVLHNKEQFYLCTQPPIDNNIVS